MVGQRSPVLSLIITLSIFLSFVNYQVSPTACTEASFPKVIGGTKGETDISQIEHKNDVIIAVGSTRDTDLIGFSALTVAPIILSYQGTSPSLDLWWSKSLKWEGYFFNGVAINTDG